MPERGRPPSTEHIGAGPTLAEIDTLYRTQSRRVLATLIRLLGDFELAEEALHDAFIAAVQQWPRDGLPSNPRAWLVSAGRFKAIDGLRQRAERSRAAGARSGGAHTLGTVMAAPPCRCAPR